MVDVDGSNLTKLIDLKGRRGQPAWSPVPVAGEHWIVYSDQADGTPDGYHDLFAYGVDTQRIIRLTWFPDITVDEPAWSADGAFLSARHQWDLHPWHVYGFIFAVEEVTTGEETVPALGSWLDTDHWNYNHWYYMDDDPLNNDNCGFGSTDWSNGQYSHPYMMLGMCGLEVTFRLDFDEGYPYVVSPDPDEIGVIPLDRAPRRSSAAGSTRYVADLGYAREVFARQLTIRVSGDHSRSKSEGNRHLCGVNLQHRRSR